MAQESSILSFTGDVDNSDEALMAAVVDGNKFAFRTLVDRYNRQAYATAYRIMNYNKMSAEDIAQKVFLKIWQQPEKFNAEKAKFSTWFYRVVTNQALDEKRKRRFSAIPEGFDQEDPSASAEEGLIEANENQLIKDAVNQLPERQQVALTLTYFEERPNAEVAEILEISVKAVESLLVRARKQLRQILS